MNRWHVYEALKRNPDLTLPALKVMFPSLSEREIREGIEEYRAANKENVMA